MDWKTYLYFMKVFMTYCIIKGFLINDLSPPHRIICEPKLLKKAFHIPR